MICKTGLKMNESILTQNKTLLKYLKKNKSGITSFMAFDMFGITRLSGRIYDLRSDGNNIESIIEMGTNRFNKPCHWARYILKTHND